MNSETKTISKTNWKNIARTFTRMRSYLPRSTNYLFLYITTKVKTKTKTKYTSPIKTSWLSSESSSSKKAMKSTISPHSTIDAEPDGMSYPTSSALATSTKLWLWSRTHVSLSCFLTSWADRWMWISSKSWKTIEFLTFDEHTTRLILVWLCNIISLHIFIT